MFRKVQFTVQINAQVFLKLYLLNSVIIKVQWRVWCLFCFTRKNNFLCLFVGIRVESHFPLICPSIQVTIRISGWQIYLIYYKRKWNVVCKKPGICCETVWKVVYIDEKQQWAKDRTLWYTCFNIQPLVASVSILHYYCYKCEKEIVLHR